jgi:putative ABC transport system permease protein
MYIIANAIKNLIRNKGRNILIAAVTLAITVSSVVTLTINNAASKVIDEIRLDLGSRVEVRQDFIEMRQAGFDARTDRSFISINDFKSYAQSDYLRKTIFNADMYALSDTFFAVGDHSYGTTTRMNDDGEVVLVETLKLISTSEPDMLPDFGTLREITNGRMFSNLGEAIISEDIASFNNVTIGDVIHLRGAYAEDKEFDLTVVGIYSDNTDEYLNPWMTMFGEFHAENRRNEIITSWETLLAADWESNAGLDMRIHYFLRNPDDIRNFEAELREAGLPVTYNVSINQAAYDKVTGPLTGMRSAILTFMIVILALGAIVLALLSFAAVRERKYEVGVLRAMGMDRGKVAFGILSESVIIAVLCLAVGIGAGSLVAQPIANSILDGRVAVSETEESPMAGRALFAGGQAQIGDGSEGYVPESEIEVSLNMDVIIQMIIVTLSLAAISGVIGVIIITQYEPLKILRERN